VRTSDDGHLDAEDVRNLLKQKLPEARGQRGQWVVSHLATGCERCRARVVEAVHQAMEAPAKAGEYGAAFDNAIAQAGVRAAFEHEDRARGARAWPELRDNPPGRRLMMVRSSRRYTTPGVLEALFRDYHQVLWRFPREGLEVALLGLEIAQRLDRRRHSAVRLADLRGEALAIAGNAHRWAGRHGEAAPLLVEAARQLRDGSCNPLAEAQLRTYFGDYWQSLRRFEKAAGAYRGAEQVYRGIGERHLAAQALVSRAESMGYLHPEQGIRLVRRAIQDIDGARDPELELAAHHNLAWYLNDAGQGWQAREQLLRSAGLYQRFGGHAVAALTRAWLEGRIERSLHQLDEARRLFERAWAGFQELDMEIHLTMLSIDRAELSVVSGELAAAAALLRRMAVQARTWGVSRETRSVLRRLREAVLSRRSTRGAFRQASLAVRRSWAKEGAAGGEGRSA
jgi:tetratricopeptide (TPR) repeat protein